MKYFNPVLKGFYPDPSVCFDDRTEKFYMVCSSFQYFPGVPLFESTDLVNWTQIGHVLTRKSQVFLDKINSSGGVFAPTIRYNNGRFYMVTTNDTTHKNFYVYTDNIHGEWSEPISVEQDGIDPSLLFDSGKVYFLSNGTDDSGEGGVVQCEINIETGEKLSHSKCIWKGSGGRFLESPHMYKIGDWYYLMAAEGGTEYGHMITCARSKSVWGEFENYPRNPVLTNRNKAPCIIQGIGHGDLIRNTDGNWYIVSLGFRQMHMWMAYHHLGREVFLTPVKFGQDGWFTAGRDGTTDESYEIPGDFEQSEKRRYGFDNMKWDTDWIYLRHPHEENYELTADRAVLHGTDVTLDDVDSPTFIGTRQRDFCFTLSAEVSINSGEGGVTLYMCENEHYDIAVRKSGNGFEAVLKLNIGGIKHIQSTVPLPADVPSASGKAKLIIRANNTYYNFYAVTDSGEEQYLGNGGAKYLSSEVSGGFTGVVMGLYSVRGTAEFTGFNVEYKD